MFARERAKSPGCVAAFWAMVADIYADDTTISYSTHSMAAPNDISDGLQTDIDEIMNWSADNKMILNESKTKSMLVTGKRLGKKNGTVHSAVTRKFY